MDSNGSCWRITKRKKALASYYIFNTIYPSIKYNAYDEFYNNMNQQQILPSISKFINYQMFLLKKFSWRWKRGPQAAGEFMKRMTNLKKKKVQAISDFLPCMGIIL